MNIGGATNKILQAVGGVPKSGGGKTDMAQLHAIVPIMQKAAYIAALTQALEKAQTSAHFNLETHKNDLWLKLDNIGVNKLAMTELAAQAAADQHNMIRSLNTMVSTMKPIMMQMTQVIRNLK
jgi:hypothetical protein